MSPEESVPSLIRKPPEAVTIWTIAAYGDMFSKSPTKFELHVQFACKVFEGMERFGSIKQRFNGKVETAVILSPLTWYGKSAAELEAILPGSVVRIAPLPGDAPNLVGVWMEG